MKNIRNLSFLAILLLLSIQTFGQNKSDTNVLPLDGKVGIYTLFPSHELEVNGTIRSQKVLVESEPWPDFVFEAGYVLPKLIEVERYIAENGHLEHIPSATDVEENGMEVGEISAKLLQKIEELTLYLIEQDKQIKFLKEEVSSLKQSQVAPDH